MAEPTVTAPTRLGPQELTKAFTFATDWLGVYVPEVNALNVYPVPDGDTGTNMHLTLQSVRRQLAEEKPTSMASFAHALSYGSLLGARGNSGVILSQVLKGFADVAKKHAQLGAAELRLALRGATRSAYGAVMKPVEGTILTVVRAVADAAEASAATQPLELMREAHRAGQEALERTPDLLPMLRQAGVVDAGGLGFLRMLEGVMGDLEGRALPEAPDVTRHAQADVEEEAFGFCTEFLLAEVDVSTKEIQKLVEPFGDSLLVVGAEGFVKGHIHTEEPERLLAEVGRHGRMVRSKVEDMSEQHSEILAGVELGEAEPPSLGLVAICDGYGVTRAFRSLGARVVGGGQTNNPSVEDIADTIRSLGAAEVIVMPNNKNILMAAERANELVPDTRVRVLPTRSVGGGLAAAVLFDEDAEPDELFEAMREAASRAHTLEVTTASRDVVIEDVRVAEGDFIGLLDGELQVSAATPEEALLSLVRSLEEADVVTLFYSASVDRARVDEVVAKLREHDDGMEIDVQPGAPELYPYLVAIE